MKRRRSVIACIATLGMAAVVLFPRALPATVEEQRARLPPAAACTDAVEGEWRSHAYNPRFRDWYVFTAQIRRAQPGSSELTGTINALSWNGTPEEAEPPPCRPGLRHWTISMTAKGTVTGLNVVFGGTSWKPEQAFCGPQLRPGQYNLDTFSGTIEPDRQEFQSLNNDNGRSVNEPVVFRRIRCADPPPAPHVSVAPPPLWRSRSGCGR